LSNESIPINYIDYTMSGGRKAENGEWERMVIEIIETYNLWSYHSSIKKKIRVNGPQALTRNWDVQL
jgi:hypothetical protein